MRAWLFQDHRQKQKLGEKAAWSVGWIDPAGKRKSKRIGCRSHAEKFARKIEGQLAAGTYENQSRTRWAEFRKEYQAKILPSLAPGTRQVVLDAFNHFERLIKPQKVSAIKTATIDDFIAKRRQMRGRKPGSKVSPATINRDLRHLKAALNVARDWGYLAAIPKFRKQGELEQVGPVVSAEHFQQIYDACLHASLPTDLGVPAADWWQALLVFALTTGWRIDEILSFRREDLDLATGAIRTKAKDNKGKRDGIDHLTDVALDHVKRIVGFQPLVFFWPHGREQLWAEFHRLQEAAGVHLPCSTAGEHQCTPACHLYGFHALRRAYGTFNADRMPAPVLQKKMRHKSFTTTLRYIQLADKMKKNSENVYVPDFLRSRAGG